MTKVIVNFTWNFIWNKIGSKTLNTFFSFVFCLILNEEPRNQLPVQN